MYRLSTKYWSRNITKSIKDYFKTSEHDDVDTDKVAHEPLTRHPCPPLLIGNGLLPLATAVSTVFLLFAQS